MSKLFLLLLMSISIASPPIAGANSVNQTFIQINGGLESRDELHWQGISIGRLFRSLAPDADAPEKLKKLMLEPDISASIKFTVGRIHDRDIDKERIDYSVIPKLRKYVSDQTYISGGVGVGFNELNEGTRNGERFELGGRLFFAPELSYGIEWGRAKLNGMIELTFTHRSNANLGDANHGLNFFLLEIGCRF